jgi:hypothetical protein
LGSVVGSAFEGTKKRTDGGVKPCQDCAQRCFVQQRDCVAFVYTPYANQERGTCDYYTNIWKLQTGASDSALAITAITAFEALSS